MSNSKISYLVTCHNEEETLDALLSSIVSNLYGGDELVILCDEIHNPKTIEIIEKFSGWCSKPPFYDKLNGDFARHKNVGNMMCKNEWILQCDGDEHPKNLVGDNLHSILNSAEKEDVELIFVPRINDFKGVTKEHAIQWGWRLSPYWGREIVNFPDYQGRIYRNIPDRIKWERKLHERIVGHNKYSFLPAEEDYALYHDKTIEKQIETNIRYNKRFSVDDNKGHVIK